MGIVYKTANIGQLSRNPLQLKNKEGRLAPPFNVSNARVKHK